LIVFFGARLVDAGLTGKYLEVGAFAGLVTAVFGGAVFTTGGFASVAFAAAVVAVRRLGEVREATSLRKELVTVLPAVRGDGEAVDVEVDARDNAAAKRRDERCMLPTIPVRRRLRYASVAVSSRIEVGSQR
jgi:hypothetical protein